MQYDRYQATRGLAKVQESNGLVRVASWADARPGDLLVYGYFDHPETQKGWHGHVVILIDPAGDLTGQRGLVLGAHGGQVRQVAYVVAQGFDQQYFRESRSELRAVLRPVEFH